MPAQKRRLSSSPSSRPRDHVETNGMTGASKAAAGSGGGEGGGSGGGVPLPPRGGSAAAAAAAAKRAADPQPQREGGEFFVASTSRPPISPAAGRDMHVAFGVSVRIWLRGLCVSMGLADSDAEFGGGVDGDSESSQSDGDMDE